MILNENQKELYKKCIFLNENSSKIDEEFLYHSSSIPNIKILKPNISTHGKSWVYATFYHVSLIFGCKRDDFDFITSRIWEKGKPTNKIELYECYPKALDKVYKNKQTSVYKVSSEGFLSGQTGWSIEFVNPNPVKVIEEIKIKDLKREITNEINNDSIVMNYYKNTEEYKNMIHDHVKDRIISFGYTKEMLSEDPRFKKYFWDIVEELGLD